MKSVNLQYRITCKSWILEISYAGCTFQMRIVYKGNYKVMKMIDRTPCDQERSRKISNFDHDLWSPIDTPDPTFIWRSKGALSYNSNRRINHVTKKYQRMNRNINERQRRERLMLTSDSTWSNRHTILEWAKSSHTFPFFNVLILNMLNELPSILDLHFKWDEGSVPTLFSTSCEDTAEIYGFRCDMQFDYMWQTSDGRIGPIWAVVSSASTTRNVLQLQDQNIYFHYGRIWSFIPKSPFEFLLKAFKEFCPDMEQYHFACACSRLNKMPPVNFEFIHPSFSGETSTSSDSRSIREIRIFTHSEYIVT